MVARGNGKMYDGIVA